MHLVLDLRCETIQTVEHSPPWSIGYLFKMRKIADVWSVSPFLALLDPTANRHVDHSEEINARNRDRSRYHMRW